MKEDNSINASKVVFRVILHVDMDAFYASIEQRDDPEIRGKPVIVGALPSQRGVVCAASYEAREFGIHASLPSFVAHQKCPEGIFLLPRMNHYREASRRIMAILNETGAMVEQTSIDEAYLDVSSLCQACDHDSSLENAVSLAKYLKQRIRDELNLTATVGIGSNKLLAKLASDYKKPDGLTLIRESDKVAFLRPLPTSKLYGIGEVTEQKLSEAHLRTVGDLQDYRGDLRAIVGSYGVKLQDYAFGEDQRPLDLGDEIKSVSAMQTFQRDTANRRILFDCLWKQAVDITNKLAARRLAARTVQVTVRYGDFTTPTHQTTLEEPLASDKEIYAAGCLLLARHSMLIRPIRMLGLGVSNLCEVDSPQMKLF